MGAFILVGAQVLRHRQTMAFLTSDEKQSLRDAPKENNAESINGPLPGVKKFKPTGKGESVSSPHMTRCTSLDSKYRPDGGSFVFELEKNRNATAVLRDIEGLEILHRMKPFDYESHFVVCKRKDAVGFDYEHSYEICGIEANLYPADEGRRFEGGLLAVNQAGQIQSSFNFGVAVPKIQDQITLKDRAWNLTDSSYIGRKVFELERQSGAIGHIAVFAKEGGIDLTKTVRIQCQSLSDNSTIVPGANH